MAEQRPRSRPGQKSFTLKEARKPFESWCQRNAYDERTIMLAGWFALHRLSHEERTQLFRAVEIADVSAGSTAPYSDAVIFDALARALDESQRGRSKGGPQAAPTAPTQTRPAEKPTTSQASSRRAS